VAGPSPENGVYFVPVNNPPAAVKVTRIAENGSSKIIGIAPQTSHQYNRVEVRTRYSGSGGLLVGIRVIASSFVLEEG